MSKVNISVLLFAAVLIVSCSVFLGPRTISPFGLSDTDREILISIRLPRVLVALLMGMALGASGALLQGILRNPLADPSHSRHIERGVAYCGARHHRRFFLSRVLYVPALAFVGAVATGGIVGVMGWKRGGLWPERLLLAGVGLSFLFSALLMLMMSISTDEGLRRAMLWIFGDLSMSEWSRIPYGLAFVAVGILLSATRAKALNALILGDEFAHSLGFAPQRERLILFVSVGLMTAASVSLGGMIGFIGLLIPHIMRFFFGADSRLLIPASALGGGSLLCIADLVSRSLLQPMELPAGVITAIIGAPYFMFLLRRKNVLTV
jgi:iron complex transport system permease protein